MGDSSTVARTPNRVADQMDEAMGKVGGDGFLIAAPGQTASRRMIVEVCEGLVPALRQRGLVCTAYDHTILRDNLRSF